MNIIKDLNVRFLQQASDIGMNHLTDEETTRIDYKISAMIVYLAVNRIQKTTPSSFNRNSDYFVARRAVEKFRKELDTTDAVAIKEVVALIKKKLPIEEIDKIIR